MIPAGFEYFAPKSVAEAVALLEQHGDDAKLLGGGHSLLPALKLRLAQTGVLIDITSIAELKGIRENGGLEIGAGATYHAIATSDLVRTHCAVLAECAGQIGDIQVRNRGTIGGSLAHADPAADLTAVALALGMTLSVQGPTGSQTINADDLFVGMLTTALQPSDVIVSVHAPKLGTGEGAAYAKLRHPASRYAIVGVAAYVKLDGGSVSVCRVAVTGAGPMAVRDATVETAMVGSDGSDAAVASAASAAGEDMDYLGDIHASDEYRKAMVKVYTKRALTAALAQARG
jgi:carbon-monoxide dehydrogenase medium subunit